MAAPDLVNLSALIDNAKCFALVRQHRWPEGVRCPACSGRTVVRDVAWCMDRLVGAGKLSGVGERPLS